ncbi:plasmid replication protein RepC [Maritalea mediterranea]|uniref:Replication protein C n=1 Tax=Maritalea mediterranea TaxID=2909667 RepID=A0ABS9E9F8_9HYPH|nr:plasmid replication protein RepC [Maritalea mediterranea]MCF4098415.1 hypothetical protein [Maritalea mediterranea]
MQNLGWRKPTPGLVAAEMHAQVGEGLSVPKSKAIIAVKKVATHIGLKPAQLMLLDILFAFSKPQDWEAGQRPLVWPSNQYLMDQTGFSLPALKRHLRRLGELGLIHFHDSPNGKRYGHRDRSERIVEAYGFDLGPLAARAGEFEALHKKIMAERAEKKQLRKKLTCTRRTIRAHLMAALEQRLSGPWLSLQEEFEVMLAEMPRSGKPLGTLRSLCQRFTKLCQTIENLYSNALQKVDATLPVTQEVEEPTPTQLRNDPHKYTTIQSSMNNKPTKRPNHTPGKTDGITFEKFCSACPNYINYANKLAHVPKSWRDLAHISEKMALMLGIDANQWGRIKAKLGQYSSAIALGLTFEKHVQGIVHNPLGYISSMAKKADLGTLHLKTSIMDG